jgi:general secretion pathway protein E
MLFERHGQTAPEVLWHATGCDACRQNGYRGRTGIFNTAVVDDAISDSIKNGCSEQDLRQALKTQGTHGLAAATLSKVAAGTCDLDDIVEMHLV